jgi:ubiquinone/menaquinone biosynthesis C-methylase UbiE
VQQVDRVPTDTVEQFYQLLWPSFESNAARFAALDAELPWPEGDPLFDAARSRSLGPRSVVLDLGCGKGKQATRFVRELGVSVIALDPLEHNLEMARGHAEREGTSHAIRFVSSSAEKLPLADESVDLVWCRDTFNHVEKIDDAMREASRVLKPGGAMINVSAVASGDFDQAEVASAIGLNPATLDKTTIDRAFEAAGLTIIEQDSVCREGSKFLEKIEPSLGRDLLRLARLQRGESKFVAELGGRGPYEQLKAYYLWNVYFAIRKIDYWVWISEKGFSR